MDLYLFLKAVILGLVEGATEFIPVSSTGHLILFQDWLNFEGKKEFAFAIFIQLGAILAVVWVYREKILHVLRTWKTPESKRLIINIVVASIPAAVIGLPTNEWVEENFSGPFTVALALLVGGVGILLIEHYFRNPTVESVDDIPLSKALWVGVFQVVAMLWPGISRSGATIMGGLGIGLSRKAATEFSFFMAIPAMLGASLVKMGKIMDVATADDVPVFATGFIVAFISALVVIRGLLTYVSKNDFKPFAWYRIALGIVLLAWYWNNPTGA
jgi:undecaprenyl-diphosphatase